MPLLSIPCPRCERGNPHIAWNDLSGGNWEIYYAYWNPFGGTTTTTTLVCQCPDDITPPTGCISGRVTNLAGQPLAGKTVILRRTSPKPRITKTAVTDSNGCYRFTDLKNGRYRTKVRNCRGGGTKTVDVAGGGKVNDVNFGCK